MSSYISGLDREAYGLSIEMIGGVFFVEVVMVFGVGLLRPVEAVLEVVRALPRGALGDIGHHELFEIEVLHLLQKFLLDELLQVQLIPTRLLAGPLLVLLEHAHEVFLALLLELVFSLHQVVGPLLHEAQRLLVLPLVLLSQRVQGGDLEPLRCLFDLPRGELHSNNNR